MRVVIFGIGSYIKILISILNKNIEMVAASYNDSSKWGTS